MPSACEQGGQGRLELREQGASSVAGAELGGWNAGQRASQCSDLVVEPVGVVGRGPGGVGDFGELFSVAGVAGCRGGDGSQERFSVDIWHRWGLLAARVGEQ